MLCKKKKKTEEEEEEELEPLSDFKLPLWRIKKRFLTWLTLTKQLDFNFSPND